MIASLWFTPSTYLSQKIHNGDSDSSKTGENQSTHCHNWNVIAQYEKSLHPWVLNKEGRREGVSHQLCQVEVSLTFVASSPCCLTDCHLIGINSDVRSSAKIYGPWHQISTHVAKTAMHDAGFLESEWEFEVLVVKWIRKIYIDIFHNWALDATGT